ncbi:putative ORFan [Tupanvirus deep ocean]|uniref:ORFan n=2 Tax=Tupanvirus TaxID=2094720 RepID=A0AC62A7Z9_9VIRU|nr:putative ORFan [Tupanvirus deep ocean]QKU33911.1 putative ORFan [Tupanvirus deep ocean]
MNKIDYHKLEVTKNVNYQISIITTVDNIMRISIINDPNFGRITLKGSTNYKINYYCLTNGYVYIKCEHTNDYQIQYNRSNIKISQIYVSEILRPAFLEDLKKCYDLVDYYDEYAPAIFYGVMTLKDLNIIMKNKSLKIIIWIGGDINYNIENKPIRSKNIINIVDILKRTPRAKHIAISSFIMRDLVNMNVPFQFVPFMGINFDLYKPVPKGNSIYLYTDLHSEGTYGRELYQKLMEKYKNINFIVACCKFSYDRIIRNKIPLKYDIKYYKKEQLVQEIYPKCFVGLRLTTHDGLAATVQELGLLGIKTIHNGSSPSSLNYNNFDDICKHIDNEMKSIGTIDYDTADKVKQYLTIDKKFFEIDSH